MLRFAVVVTASIARAASIDACATLGIVNKLVSTGMYTASADLAYGADPRENLDAYQPHLPADTPVPPGGYLVVVFFHCGKWTGAERGDYKFIRRWRRKVSLPSSRATDCSRRFATRIS